MDMCPEIGKALGSPIVKTIFLSNHQVTSFYIFVTTAEKHFSAKQFGAGLGVSRVSFAPEEYLEKKLGTKIGATTALSALSPLAHDVRYVFDRKRSPARYGVRRTLDRVHEDTHRRSA